MKWIRIILLILNILAAVGLVLTTLAGSVAPTTSILPSVMAYGFVPMLGVNLLLIVLWLAMGRWEFLLSVAVIAWRFSYVGLFFQIGGTATIPPRDEHPGLVTLMSYNLHQFGGNGVETLPADSNAQAFLDMVRTEKPDILCLQEYQRTRGVNTTDSLELMGYNHYFAAHGTGDNPSGTVVFSRLPITRTKRVDGQKVLVEVLKEERHFSVLCVHMDSYAFDAHDRADIEQMKYGKVDSLSRRTLSKAKETVLTHAKEWKEQLEPLIADCQNPLLLAGDMNDIPSSWLYSRISEVLDDTYRDKGLGFCTTFNGGFPRFRIDMVFHSAQFATLSYRRLRSNLSDHYPVLVSLELND